MCVEIFVFSFRTVWWLPKCFWQRTFPKLRYLLCVLKIVCMLNLCSIWQVNILKVLSKGNLLNYGACMCMCTKGFSGCMFFVIAGVDVDTVPATTCTGTVIPLHDERLNVHGECQNHWKGGTCQCGCVARWSRSFINTTTQITNEQVSTSSSSMHFIMIEHVMLSSCDTVCYWTLFLPC